MCMANENESFPDFCPRCGIWFSSRHRDDSGTTGAGSINWDIGEDETAASNW